MQRLTLLASLCLCAALAALVAFVLAAAMTPKAYAGGWTSGGGELLESASNPWFIQAGGTTPAGEKKIIFYCLEIDEENFGVTRRDALHAIDAAFTFWLDEFTAAEIPDNPYGGNRVHVARESFFPKPSCAPDVALRFQFGVLDDEQMLEFERHGQEPKKLVAVAVRREYDEETLQTKHGFVYISPPKGPLAMIARDLAQDPWRADSHIRLALILRHELGHVFGLSHEGTHRRVMGAGFPENLVSVKAALYYPMLDSVFKVPLGVALGGQCYSGTNTMPATLRDFFSVPPDLECLAIQMQRDRLEIVGWNTEDWDRKIVVGIAPLATPVVTHKTPLVRLWLPDAQKVYTKIPDFLGKILSGPTVVKAQRTGTFVPTQGNAGGTHPRREISVDIAPERVQVNGVVDGKIQLNVLSYPAYY